MLSAETWGSKIAGLVRQLLPLNGSSPSSALLLLSFLFLFLFCRTSNKAKQSATSHFDPRKGKIDLFSVRPCLTRMIFEYLFDNCISIYQIQSTNRRREPQQADLKKRGKCIYFSHNLTSRRTPGLSRSHALTPLPLSVSS